MKNLRKSFLKILSKKFIDKCIFKFLNGVFQRKLKVPTVSKKELRIVFPCLGYVSNITKTKLTTAANKNQKLCKLKVLFKTKRKLNNYFRYKDLVPETLRSNRICDFTCET